jgi:uncharacterized protein (TIGR00299 family) protein
MILAALFDLGADPGQVTHCLQAAGLPEAEVRFCRKPDRHGLACGYVEVLEAGRPADGGQAHEREHKHGHGHGYGHEQGQVPWSRRSRPPRRTPAVEQEQEHEQEQEREHAQGGGHQHRGLSEILDLIGRLEAPARARERAASIFRRLGEAEAAVHGVPIEAVHFHEVGAVDSIADIVGICLAIEQLGVERVYCSAVPVGEGTIRCAHGVLPNPAPATARLLAGASVVRLPIQAELTTPTGAAVLTTLSEGPWTGLPLRLLGTGVGHGRKEFDKLPNIVRAFLAEVADVALPGRDTVSVLECDTDDQTGEVSGALTEELRQAGALDVTLMSVQMKKHRPGVRLTVLCRPEDAGRLAGLVLSRSSTIGVRSWQAERHVLPRGKATADTPWGPVECKRIERPDGVELAPEFESARRVADSAGVPVRHVLDAARRWEPGTGAPASS